MTRLVLREPRLLWSVALLLRGRRDGVPPAAGFGGYRDALPLWVVIGSVAVVEVAVTALLPLPTVVHGILLVLGVWGAVVVLGLVAALVVHPHLVTDDRLLLRSGFWTEIVVPRDAVAEVHRVSQSGKRGLAVHQANVTLTPSGTTNVSRPVAVGNGVGDRDPLLGRLPTPAGRNPRVPALEEAHGLAGHGVGKLRKPTAGRSRGREIEEAHGLPARGFR